jgi:hypothetical protein
MGIKGRGMEVRLLRANSLQCALHLEHMPFLVRNGEAEGITGFEAEDRP